MVGDVEGRLVQTVRIAVHLLNHIRLQCFAVDKFIKQHLAVFFEVSSTQRDVSACTLTPEYDAIGVNTEAVAVFSHIFAQVANQRTHVLNAPVSSLQQ